MGLRKRLSIEHFRDTGDRLYWHDDDDGDADDGRDGNSLLRRRRLSDDLPQRSRGRLYRVRQSVAAQSRVYGSCYINARFDVDFRSGDYFHSGCSNQSMEPWTGPYFLGATGGIRTAATDEPELDAAEFEQLVVVFRVVILWDFGNRLRFARALGRGSSHGKSSAEHRRNYGRAISKWQTTTQKA